MTERVPNQDLVLTRGSRCILTDDALETYGRQWEDAVLVLSIQLFEGPELDPRLGRWTWNATVEGTGDLFPGSLYDRELCLLAHREANS